MKKAIAMRCTEKQFESLQPKLKKLGLESCSISNFKQFEYLANNFGGISNHISNLHYSQNGLKDRWEVHETWNEKVFLEACGIKAEKTIITNKLTELENRVEVLEAKIKQDSVINMPIESKLKPLIIDKKGFQAFKEAIEANKILLPNLSDTINMVEELKNYSKPISYGIDFGYHPSIENLKLKARIEELEAENKAILAGNAFNEFKKGDWITLIHDVKTIVCVTDFEESIGYGVNSLGYWCKETDNNCWSFNYEKEYWREATESEVFEALKKEAVKRGFVSGCYHTVVNNGDKVINCEANYPVRFGFDSKENKLLLNNWAIFKDGFWASVQQVISRSEAEKQLGKKIID